MKKAAPSNAEVLEKIDIDRIPTALATRLHLRPLHADEWTIAVAGGALACLPLLRELLVRTPRSKVRA